MGDSPATTGTYHAKYMYLVQVLLQVHSNPLKRSFGKTRSGMFVASLHMRKAGHLRVTLKTAFPCFRTLIICKEHIINKQA